MQRCSVICGGKAIDLTSCDVAAGVGNRAKGEGVRTEGAEKGRRSGTRREGEVNYTAAASNGSTTSCSNCMR